MCPAGIPNLSSKTINQAVIDAVSSVNNSRLQIRNRRIPLLGLGLQSNTICAIIHNLVAKRISELNPKWTFRPHGGAGGDLGGPRNIEVEIKTTTDKRIKGNRVTFKPGYSICVFLTKPSQNTPLEIKEVRCGFLQRRDWTSGGQKTQFSFVKGSALSRLRKVM